MVEDTCRTDEKRIFYLNMLLRKDIFRTLCYSFGFILDHVDNILFFCTKLRASLQLWQSLIYASSVIVRPLDRKKGQEQ